MGKHYMVCISGFSGTGKDEVARILREEFEAIQTGLADPAKRHMADVYGFTEQQLFGPSHFRNAGDLRYLKSTFEQFELQRTHSNELLALGFKDFDPDKRYYVWTGRGLNGGPEWDWVPYKLGAAHHLVEEGDPYFWLSPRETLQRYCELLNEMYLRTWSRKGMEIHKQLGEYKRINGEKHFLYHYSRMKGITPNLIQEIMRKPSENVVTCFADFRHIHEIEEANNAETEDFIPVLLRVKRPGIDNPPFNHRSETEQTRIKDRAFDFLIKNDGTLEDLRRNVVAAMKVVQGENWSKNRIIENITVSQ